MYRDVEGPTKPVEDLNEICHRIPIHLILGKVDDLMYVNLLFPFIQPRFSSYFDILLDLHMSIKPL